MVTGGENELPFSGGSVCKIKTLLRVLGSNPSPDIIRAELVALDGLVTTLSLHSRHHYKLFMF